MPINKAFLYTHLDRVNEILESLPSVIEGRLSDIPGNDLREGRVFEAVFDTNSDNVLYRVIEADAPGADAMGGELCVELPGNKTTFRVYGAAMSAFA